MAEIGNNCIALVDLLWRRAAEPSTWWLSWGVCCSCVV